MNKLTTWGMHAAASVLTALVVTGAIYDLVPPGHRETLVALMPALAYLLGVKMPTPTK